MPRIGLDIYHCIQVLYNNFNYFPVAFYLTKESVMLNKELSYLLMIAPVDAFKFLSPNNGIRCLYCYHVKRGDCQISCIIYSK